MTVAPLATFLTRKFGKHYVLLLGSCLQCSGYIVASFATRIWHLYLSQGFLVGCGIGFIIIPSMAILSQWFERKRSVANGLSSAGSGIGGVIFTWGTAAMIRDIGLKWTLRTTGLITLAATVTATLFLRDRNHHIKPTQLAFDVTLLRRYDVMLLLTWAFISMFGYITLLYSLSDYATSLGLDRQQATNLVGILNLGTAVGRPVIGIASDRFSRTNTAAVLTALCGIICFALWLPAKTFGMMVVFAFICGAILGVFWMVSSGTATVLGSFMLTRYAQTIGPLCVEVAGLKNLPSLLSLSWCTVIIPTACKCSHLSLLDLYSVSNSEISVRVYSSVTTPSAGKAAVSVPPNLCRSFVHSGQSIHARALACASSEAIISTRVGTRVIRFSLITYTGDYEKDQNTVHTKSPVTEWCWLKCVLQEDIQWTSCAAISPSLTENKRHEMQRSRPDSPSCL